MEEMTMIAEGLITHTKDQVHMWSLFQAQVEGYEEDEKCWVRINQSK
jgi:hypothetical protein